MKRWSFFRPAFLALVCALWFSSVNAGVHFAALPDRTAATLSLTDAGALVAEMRVIGLEQGINEVRFSWQGLPVLEDSIRLFILDGESITDVLGVSHPAGEAAMVWQIYCSESALVPARINYVLSRIDGLFPIRIISDEEEISCRLERYLVLRNFSGEDFEQISVISPGGSVSNRPVRHGETLRMLLSAHDGVGVEKFLRYDSRNAPGTASWKDNGISVYYRIANSVSSGLGQTPIPGGKARVFNRDSRGEALLLGEDRIETVHPGEYAEIYLGETRDIAVHKTLMKEQPVNIRRNRDDRIVLHDTDEIVRFVIENFKDASVLLNLRHHIPGQWEMTETSLPFTRTGAHIVELNVSLQPGDAKEVTLHYTRRNVRPSDSPVRQPAGFIPRSKLLEENR